MRKITNIRDKYFVQYDGDKMTLCKACRLSGLRYGSVYHSMVGDVTPQEAFDYHIERKEIEESKKHKK